MALPIASSSKAPSLVQEGVPSGLNLSLHPLPLLSISEHFTRTRFQSGSNQVQVYGALLGTQTGRDVEIVNSFEVVAAPGDNSMELDHGLFKTRQEQFKQVFPTLDFLGWYAIGPYPTPAELALHIQFLTYSESPLLLMLSPSQSSAIRDLPVAIFEGATEIFNNETKQSFIRCAYKIETGEAERVAVDGIAKPSGPSPGGDSALLANLTTQRNAIKMLHDRIKLIVSYLDGTTSGSVPCDSEVLRQINSLVTSLPAIDNHDFRAEYMKEYNDVLLTSYLAAQTKALNSTNELFDKYLFLTTGNGRESGVGGSGGRQDVRGITVGTGRRTRPGPRGEMFGH